MMCLEYATLWCISQIHTLLLEMKISTNYLKTSVAFLYKKHNNFNNFRPHNHLSGILFWGIIQYVENNVHEHIHGNILIKRAKVGSYPNVPQ